MAKSDKDKPAYHSHLSSDPKYLKETASKIKERPPLEEIRFDYLNQALQDLGINDDPYASVTLQAQKTPEVQKLVETSFTRVNEVGPDNAVRSQIERLWDYLSKSDPLKEADLIFTFGGQGSARVEEAIRLYQKNYAPKILFTGQKAAYMPEVTVSEADYYAQKAVAAGISAESLILERDAVNTVGNAVNSIHVLREMNFLPKTIILINHNFQMRRSYLTFKTNADWNPELIRHAVAGEKYTRDSYYKEMEGWSYVFYEYIKLYGARLMKHF